MSKKDKTRELIIFKQLVIGKYLFNMEDIGKVNAITIFFSQKPLISFMISETNWFKSIKPKWNSKKKRFVSGRLAIVFGNNS